MVKQLCFSCMWPTKMTGTNRCHKTRSFRVNLQVTVFRAQLDRPQSQFWFVPQELWILQPLSISLLMQIALFHPGLTINWDLLILAAINTNALVPKSESASEITVASWNPIFLSSSRLLELPKGKKLPYWTQRQDKSRRCNCRSKCTRSRLLPRRLPFHSPRNLCEESEGRLFVLRRVSTLVSHRVRLNPH